MCQPPFSFLSLIIGAQAASAMMLVFQASTGKQAALECAFEGWALMAATLVQASAVAFGALWITCDALDNPHGTPPAAVTLISEDN
ncbi:hypothetical protein T484DRAFT_1787592 [Baffinella frigidus]|nr:hypothetical protein T484DRAFT_1787592 [Cryptophyta sp. CCMP2293]